ncbi:hypothetical protein RCL1_001212 [Eukaryota sp. TZLM3-RCL]
MWPCEIDSLLSSQNNAPAAVLSLCNMVASTPALFRFKSKALNTLMETSIVHTSLSEDPSFWSTFIDLLKQSSHSLSLDLITRFSHTFLLAPTIVFPQHSQVFSSLLLSIDLPIVFKFIAFVFSNLNSCSHDSVQVLLSTLPLCIDKHNTSNSSRKWTNLIGPLISELSQSIFPIISDLSLTSTVENFKNQSILTLMSTDFGVFLNQDLSDWLVLLPTSSINFDCRDFELFPSDLLLNASNKRWTRVIFNMIYSIPESSVVFLSGLFKYLSSFKSDDVTINDPFLLFAVCFVSLVNDTSSDQKSNIFLSIFDLCRRSFGFLLTSERVSFLQFLFSKFQPDLAQNCVKSLQFSATLCTVLPQLALEQLNLIVFDDVILDNSDLLNIVSQLVNSFVSSRLFIELVPFLISKLPYCVLTSDDVSKSISNTISINNDLINRDLLSILTLDYEDFDLSRWFMLYLLFKNVSNQFLVNSDLSTWHSYLITFLPLLKKAAKKKEIDLDFIFQSYSLIVLKVLNNYNIPEFSEEISRLFDGKKKTVDPRFAPILFKNSLSTELKNCKTVKEKLKLFKNKNLQLYATTTCNDVADDVIFELWPLVLDYVDVESVNYERLFDLLIKTDPFPLSESNLALFLNLVERMTTSHVIKANQTVIRIVVDLLFSTLSNSQSFSVIKIFFERILATTTNTDSLSPFFLSLIQIICQGPITFLTLDQINHFIELFKSYSFPLSNQSITTFNHCLSQLTRLSNQSNCQSFSTLNDWLSFIKINQNNDLIDSELLSFAMKLHPTEFKNFMQNFTEIFNNSSLENSVELIKLLKVFLIPSAGRILAHAIVPNLTTILSKLIDLVLIDKDDVIIDILMEFLINLVSAKAFVLSNRILTIIISLFSQIYLKRLNLSLKLFYSLFRYRIEKKTNHFSSVFPLFLTLLVYISKNANNDGLYSSLISRTVGLLYQSKIRDFTTIGGLIPAVCFFLSNSSFNSTINSDLILTSYQIFKFLSKTDQQRLFSRLSSQHRDVLKKITTVGKSLKKGL